MRNCYKQTSKFVCRQQQCLVALAVGFGWLLGVSHNGSGSRPRRRASLFALLCVRACVCPVFFLSFSIPPTRPCMLSARATATREGGCSLASNSAFTTQREFFFFLNEVQSRRALFLWRSVDTDVEKQNSTDRRKTCAYALGVHT